jgi:hypothetical protein
MKGAKAGSRRIFSSFRASSMKFIVPIRKNKGKLPASKLASSVLPGSSFLNQ